MIRSAPLLAKLTLPLLFLAGIALADWARPSDPAPGRDDGAVVATPDAFYSTPFSRRPNPRVLTEVGRRLFMEPALSASGQLACASCHDPAHAFGPPDARAVRLGGAGGALPGLRAVPSLKYLQDTPPFAEHFYDNDGNDSEDAGPTGGLNWDGRSPSAHEQAAAPLLSPFEMANASPAALVARARAAPSVAALLRDNFGAEVFDHPQHAWNAIVLALEVFQQDPATFYPYDSKYDAALRSQVTLSAAERHGLALFNDAEKGNCAACHLSNVKRGAFPQFTDHGLIAIGVPRNPDIPANAAPGFFDLGLCGPLRTDLADHPEYCGLFKTPSLRNVALRPVFFHNGVYKHLEDAVRFYAQRDSTPERVYSRDAAGHVRPYDDLPVAARANLNMDAPFGAKRGARPALTDAEIGDIVAFLKTLNDGFVPPTGVVAKPPA